MAEHSSGHYLGNRTTSRKNGVDVGGYYCSGCGALYKSLGYGAISCQQCGKLGLRGFDRKPKRVSCAVDGCDFIGWDDGGVNDDLGSHKRREHADG